MKCKKILQLLSFFVMFFSTEIYSAVFSVVDLERLIMNHPMMKNYDPDTCRFKNTSGEVRKIPDIKAEIADIETDICKIGQNKQKLLDNSFQADSQLDEQAVWQQIRSYDKRTTELKQKLAELKELLYTGGVPPVSRNLPIARQIMRDVQKNYRISNTVVLNKLPRFYQHPPIFKENPLRAIFFAPDKSKLPADYLKSLSSVSLLFRKVANPVIYQKEDTEK
ncbi:MAG: hypothetical protein Kow0029_23070 [Candidatus Rifleibacteriota bacterium]